MTTVQQHSTGSTSTIAVSMNFSNKLTLKDWNNRMPTMDFLNLEGNKRRDKRLPFNTWNTSELQGNVVGFLFSTFDPPGNPSQGIHYCATPRQTGSVPQTTGTGTSFTRDEEQNRSTLPMPTFARRPSTMSSLIPVEVQQNSISKYRNCNSTNSLHLPHSYVG